VAVASVSGGRGGDGEKTKGRKIEKKEGWGWGWGERMRIVIYEGMDPMSFCIMFMLFNAWELNIFCSVYRPIIDFHFLVF
jgi:hypothetical protein